MSKPASIPARGMVYNEFGDLVEPEELTKPTDGSEILPMMRLINKSWHYNVSLYSPFYPFNTSTMAALYIYTPIMYLLYNFDPRGSLSHSQLIRCFSFLCMRGMARIFALKIDLVLTCHSTVQA